MEHECKNIVEIGEGPSICTDNIAPNAIPLQEKDAYGIKIQLDIPYSEALSLVKESVAEEGLEVLTEIDLKALFHEKLGIDSPPYSILGVYDAKWAHRAVQAKKELGLSIPCNIIVYEQEGGSAIEAGDRIVQMAASDGSDLQDIARTIKHKLEDVIDTISEKLT